MAYTFSTVDFYTQLRVGNDIYTEYGNHRCAPQPTPSSASYVGSTVSAVVPKNADIFGRMEISRIDNSGTVRDLSHPGIIQPSFLVVTDSRNAKIYGWIDNIRVKTYNAPGYSYIIDWHVDWWLTSGNLASYGEGRLLRGPSSYARPDPSSPRLWKYDSKVIISDVSNVASPPWCIVQYVKNTYDANDPDEIVKTEICTRFWNFYAQAMDLSQNTYDPISIQELYSGLLEDEMGLDPDTVIGAWICPIQPFEMANLAFNGDKYWWEADGLTPRMTTFSTSGYSGETTDSVKYIVTDPYGAVVGTVPWGLAFTKVVVYVDVGAAGANLMLRFMDGATYKTGEGRDMTVPLISVPVTSNARASYTYSGQRAYDIESKRIQNEQALISGIAGAGTSAIGGAIAGGTVGPGGMAAGAVGGLLSSVLGSAANYAATGIYDKQSQAATDRLMSNQANNVIVNTGGLGWYASEAQWYIVKMTRDAVSLAELTAEQGEHGYLTDIWFASCSSLIAAKGPMRIEGLQVWGPTPVAARYIQAMFARGVYLD